MVEKKTSKPETPAEEIQELSLQQRVSEIERVLVGQIIPAVNNMGAAIGANNRDVTMLLDIVRRLEAEFYPEQSVEETKQ